ncbi:treacle protein-like [Hypomesus transpacificus]|uniref:treacle protein-like n=1 Tax=Hypomesus transpacificus TaxID=137520 RepID=UPI001F087526|nr:treacle protein-like [Hypomesus transpacificus]
MGGGTSKGITLGGRKKEEPAPSTAWNSLKGALSLHKPPQEKKRNSTLLDKLLLEPFKKEGSSQKRFSLAKDGKGPLSIKKLSLNTSKEESKSWRNLGREQKKKKEKEKKQKKKGGKGVFDSVLNYSPPRQRFSLVEVLA